MKALFFQYFFFIKFFCFFEFKSFLFFFAKKLTIKVEKTFLTNNIICCAFYSFTDFEEDSSSQVYFQKKPNFPTYSRSLTISVAFYGEFAII